MDVDDGFRLLWKWVEYITLEEGVSCLFNRVQVELFPQMVRHPAGFGFAAGAIIYLVLSEFIPKALDLGASLPGGGRQDLVSGIMAGMVLMRPLAIVRNRLNQNPRSR